MWFHIFIQALFDIIYGNKIPPEQYLTYLLKNVVLAVCTWRHSLRLLDFWAEWQVEKCFKTYVQFATYRLSENIKNYS